MLVAFVKHVNVSVRKTVSESEHFMLFFLDPVEGTLPQPPAGIMARSTRLGWFAAQTAVVKVSANGSVEGLLLAAFVKHVNVSVRRTVP